MQMRQVNVANGQGLHARAAAKVVQIAAGFRCSVSLAFNGRKADARHLLAVMLLAANVGSTIVIRADGPDESEAVEALARLLGEVSI